MTKSESKILSDLEKALDEMWIQGVKVYRERSDEYIRGQLNVVGKVISAIHSVQKTERVPKDLFEWLKIMNEGE